MARLGRFVRVAVCAAAALGTVVSAAPLGGEAAVAAVLARGYAVVDAIDGSIAAAINRKVHALVAVGGCSGGYWQRRGEVSTWLHKVRPPRPPIFAGVDSEPGRRY
jgi:hypothetical protein